MKLFGRSEKTKSKTDKLERDKSLSLRSRTLPSRDKNKALETKSKQGTPRKIDDLPARVLIFPHISEKSSRLAEDNKYIFKIFLNANKNQIKKAVEKLYGVEVKSVNIVKMKRKKRRLGRIEGYKPRYKKAIVTLKEGYKIELIPR